MRESESGENSEKENNVHTKVPLCDYSIVIVALGTLS